MLRDLSSRSWKWFDRVYEAALAHYAVQAGVEGSPADGVLLLQQWFRHIGPGE